MVQRFGSAAALLFALIVPALTILVTPTTATNALITAGAVLAVLVAASLVQTVEWMPSPSRGPVPGVRLRERGVAIALSDPDSPGHPRPRAPGLALA